MIKSYMKHTLLLLAVGGLFAACDSYKDDNWSPGEQVAEGVQGAFFPEDVEENYALSGDTVSTFEITVSRIDTTYAAKVGVTLVSRDTTTIELVSDSVEFAKGESTATIKMRAEGLPEPAKKITETDTLDVPYYYTFKLALDKAEWNDYAAGTNEATFTVFKGNLWNVIIKNAKFYFSSSTSLPNNIHGKIEQYMNKNRFRFVDFMRSGVDWEFKIDSPEESLYYGDYTNIKGDDYTKWYGSVNMAYDEYHSYNYDGSMIYFMPDKENSVYSWTVPGYSLNYSSFCVWNGYSYIDFTSKYFSTWAYGYGDDNSSSVEGYFYVTWK